MAIAQGTISVNEKKKDEESVVVTVADDTLSRLRLALGSSMCRGQTMGSSLRDGRLDATMSARQGGSISLFEARKIGAMVLARRHPKRMRLDT